MVRLGDDVWVGSVVLGVKPITVNAREGEVFSHVIVPPLKAEPGVTNIASRRTGGPIEVPGVAIRDGREVIR